MSPTSTSEAPLSHLRIIFRAPLQQGSPGEGKAAPWKAVEKQLKDEVHNFPPQPTKAAAAAAIPGQSCWERTLLDGPDSTAAKREGGVGVT